jgi:type I restriction enzyme S subunit
MRSNYKRLGDYIEPCDEKNIQNGNFELRGISNRKYFQKAKTNTNGVDMTTYRIVRRGQFAFNRATTRNGDKISIALSKEDDCIVSPSYRIFRSKDENVLNSEYLLMWFKRHDFDRYARFKSHGSAHEFFDYDEMCDVLLPIPSIEKQREIVNEYNTIQKRIELNNQLIQNLEDTAQTIYKQWFVEGVDLEKLPEGWCRGYLKDICEFSIRRIALKVLNYENYISTENMLPDRFGIINSNSLPTSGSVINYEIGNILVSNIRPYLKKIWLANFEGGCSNDVLCFVPKSNIPSLFLFQVLEKDAFFDYVMAGSKGTKMPRGDKKWIMNYEILIPNNDLLEKFEKVSQIFQKVIHIKKKQNYNLEKFKELLLAKMTKIENVQSK